MTALIALNGKIDHLPKLKSILSELTFDYIVGVDGGLRYLERLGYEADIMIGDFDSTNLEYFQNLWPNAKIMRFNVEKDMTDSELAFSHVGNKEFDEVIVIGAFGGRIDHLLANIFLLERYPQIMLLEAHNRAKLLVGPCSREIIKRSGYLSLIPLSESVSGVSLKGFKYPLDGVTLKRSSTWGISNEILEEHASITIKSGKVIAVVSEDQHEFL